MSHYHHLTNNDRFCIVHFQKLCYSCNKIAKEISRSNSNISREIKHSSINKNY